MQKSGVKGQRLAVRSADANRIYRQKTMETYPKGYSQENLLPRDRRNIHILDFVSRGNEKKSKKQNPRFRGNLYLL